MVFHLASLPSPTFALISTIFDEYSKGMLKGQKLPRSKKSPSKVLELKGSNFKCLRGIEPSVAESLLSEISEGEMSLSELQIQCQDIKQLGKIQSSFIKATNCPSWKDAYEKYPLFTSSDNLEPFKKLNFNQPTIPDDFIKYCQLAMKKQEGTDENTRSYDEDDAVFVLERGSAVGVFWKEDFLRVSGGSVCDVFEKVYYLTSV
jgi:mannosyltransferase OCH1-like enzyme